MKKALSVIIIISIFMSLLPSVVFTAQADEAIAQSRFFPVDEYYFEYVQSPNAAAQGDYSGAVQAISNAISAVVTPVNISAYNIPTSQMAGIFTNEIFQNPAFFYLNGVSYTYNQSTNIVIDVRFTYYYDTPTIQQMKGYYEAAVLKALSFIQSNMTNAEKTLAMHDFLVLNAKYAYENESAQIAQTAYGVLVNGTGVCNGYALAYKELLSRLSIPVVKVNSASMSHAWNMVYLVSNWYHVDVTWDDPICSTANEWLNNDYDLEGRVEHHHFLLSDTAITNMEYSGWLPNTNTATSTLYDGDYSNIKSGMFYYQGYWYYNKNGSFTRSLFNTSSSSVIKTINGIDNTYSYLGVFNNELYYNITASDNSTSEIRKYKPDSSADTRVLLINNSGQTIKEKITEMVIQNNQIKYTVYRWPASGSAQYAVRYLALTQPVINGVVENGLYNSPVTITFESGLTAVLNGNSFVSGNTVSTDGTYTIVLTDPVSSLTTTIHFTVDKTVPATPTLISNPTTPTNDNVTVTITYPADAAIKQYKIGAGAWTTYTAAVVLTANNTVYARGTDAAGNVSAEGSKAVSNIDKTPPAAPTLTANPTTLTNGNVTVTISYPADAAIKQYKIGAGAWTTYTAPVVLTANNTVYARGTDAAGNVSAEGSKAVSNIDKTPPAAPTLTANPTTLTNGNVTVTISYPADAAIKEYKIGAGAWTTYTAAVVLTANNTVYARGTDAAGNVSVEGSKAVSNIDKTPPAAPTLTANPTTLTNGNVTVTITYPADAAIKEYKIGEGAWTAYTAPVVLTANNTVYARGTDAAGNTGAISSINVTNIYELSVKENSTAIINSANNYIYGLATGLTPSEFENSFINLDGDVKFVYHPDTGFLGTGTKVDLVYNTTNEIIQTYTIIIYGDVNGDGNVDSLDGGLLVDYENYVVAWNTADHAATLEAADINGDGNIDSLDAGLVVDAENYLVTIDQSNGLASL